MKIENISPSLLNQAEKLRSHVAVCESHFAICQYFQKYNIDTGVSLDVLMRVYHSKRITQAFIKISPTNDVVQKAVQGILADKFKLSFVPELDSYLKQNVCFSSCNK